jgi:prepilin-type processing-associated H-X9-DG protein
MNGTQTPVKNRQTRYDLNFKRSAVELWQSSGRSAAAVAAELGISGQILPGRINMSFADNHAELVKLNDLWNYTWHRGCVAPSPHP